MQKTLYVPEVIAKAREKKNKTLWNEKKLETLQKLPDPTGWRILILPHRAEEKSSGGVYLPDEYLNRETLATVVGYVLKVGPLAYQDVDKFGGSEPWCAAGDYVVFGRYAGARLKFQGEEIRLLNDDEILARVENPEDIFHT